MRGLVVQSRSTGFSRILVRFDDEQTDTLVERSWIHSADQLFQPGEES